MITLHFLRPARISSNFSHQKVKDIVKSESSLQHASRVFYKLLFLSIALLSLVSTLNAQEQKGASFIKVKFDESFIQTLEQSEVGVNNVGILTTGIHEIDSLAKVFDLNKMERVFPYNKKFDKRHREHGLHLWYQFSTATQVDFSASMCASSFEKCDFVVLAEAPLAKTFNDGYDSSSLDYLAVDDPRFSDQWGYENTGQTGGTADADIDLTGAWAVQAGQSNVVVAIIDGGLEVDHEDLEDNIWVNIAERDGVAGVDDDGNGYIDDINGYGFGDARGDFFPHRHGVHVGGTVGAVNNNSMGVSGVAGGTGIGDGVSMMSCAVFGFANNDGFDEAFVYAADNGAIIAQNSWGYTSPGAYEQSVLDAIDYFIANAGYDESGSPVGPMQGGLVVFAAGNSNSSADYYPGYYEPVIAVASTDHNDVRSSFSNYGAWVDIAAPGSNILSTSPDNTYSLLSGTSMACPHVSGVAALIVSEFGGMGFDPSQVRGRLTGTTDNIDVRNPSYIGQLGTGRLNGFNSLQDDTGEAPAAIADLAAVNPSGVSITLNWTAPGSSGDEGKAVLYDARYSTTPINDENFENATEVSGFLEPSIAGTSESFVVAGLSPLTTYYFVIKTTNFFGNESEISNSASAITSGIPQLNVSPNELDVVLDQGESTMVEFTISNSGDDNLDFSIPQFRTASDAYNQAKNETSIIDFGMPEVAKGEIDTRVGHPVLLGAGDDGEDGFGYRWIDSNETGGPVFYWEDIRDDGTNISLSDDSYAELSLPFSFPFYGENKSSVFVSSNGFLSFSASGASRLSNVQIPNSSTPNDIVAAYWDDLFPSAAGAEVHYLSSADEFVVQYTNVDYFGYNPSKGLTFQIILRSTGQIELKYLEMEDRSSATVGIENATGDAGLQVAFNTPYVQDSLSVLIFEGEQFIVDVSPAEGTIAPGASLDISVEIDAVDLAAGNYLQPINISSNDPVTPTVDLPVNLHINGVPQISLSAMTLDFGESYIGHTDSLMLEITNVGSDTLIISGLTTDLTEYYVDDSDLPADIWLGFRKQIWVKFTPSDAGVFTDVLHISSNDATDPILDVALTGVAISPPSLDVSPPSITATLNTGETTSQTLTINNSVAAGGGDLEFQISNEISTSEAGAVASKRGKPEKIKKIPEGLKYSGDKLFVYLSPIVQNNEVNEIKADLNVQSVKRFRHTRAELWTLSGVSVSDAISKLYDDNRVIYAEPDYEVRAIGEPNDPRFGDLWGLHNTGQSGGVEDADIDAFEAWDISTESSSIVVGIIDTGIDYTHEDLDDNIWINEDEIPGNGIDDDSNGYIDDIYGWDFVNNDNDPMDGNNHGTHVAGTVGAEGDNEIGIAGVTWDVQLMALKFLSDGGSGNTSNAILAIEYAIDNGADLTNNSWGGGGFSQTLKDVIDAASDAGQLFVAAAGNSGLNTDVSPQYPASYESENIISVAATDRTDGLASFSNYGLTTVDLAAPGVDVLSSIPGNAYASFNGTSMAAPHVAGALALTWGRMSGASHLDLKDLLLESADSVLSVKGRTVTGGRLNVYEMMKNSSTWLELDIVAGTVAAGNSQDVIVSLNAEGLSGGTYESTLVVTSNDPAIPQFDVPVILEVIGAPDIELSRVTVDFGTHFTGAVVMETVTINNVGTDDLEITNITSDNADFTVDWTTATLAVGESQDLVLTYTPGAVEADAGVLTILSNDSDESELAITLAGQGVAAPVIDVTPGVFDITLNSGDSTGYIMTIDNTAGGSDLTWQTDIAFSASATALHVKYEEFIAYESSKASDASNSGLGRVASIPMSEIEALSGEVQILSWVTYVDMSGEYPNTLNAISQYFTDYTVNTTTEIDPTALAALLSGVDVFLIPEQETGGSSSYYYNLGVSWTEALTNFVSGGGIIVHLSSSNDSEQIYAGSGLWNLTVSGSNSGGLNMPVVEESHELTEGLSSSTIASQNATFAVDISGSDALSVVEMSGGSSVAVKEVGSGNIIYLGYDFFDYDDDAARLISNAVSSSGNNSWLSLGTESGTVSAGSTQDVNVSIDADGLLGGTYESNIIISSDDPVTPQVDVPVTLEVIGVPNIEVSQTAVDFGTHFTGAVVMETVTINNVGTDDLEITNITSDNADFTVDWTTATLAAGESQGLVLTYTPGAVEADAGVLTILSNDSDESELAITLAGQGVAAPVIDVTPGVFDITLNSGDSTGYIMTIDNTAGGSDLTWQAGIAVSASATALHVKYEDFIAYESSKASDASNSGLGRVASIPMSEIEALSGEVQILSWVTYVDMSGEYPNTLNAISQYFTDYTVNTTTEIDPTALAALLSGVDVFLIPEQETGGSSSYYYNLGVSWTEALTNFVSGGGIIVHLSSSNGSEQIYAGSGLWNLTVSGSSSGGLNMPVIEESHELTEGLSSSTIASQNATFAVDISGSDALSVVEMSGGSSVAVKEVGSGNIIYLGYDFFDYDDDAARLISNAVSSSGNNSWLSLETESGTVSAGSTQEVNVSIDADGLLGGTYESNIIISSNDPVSPQVDVPVTLEVIGVPNIEVSQTAVDFGAHFTGAVVMETVTINNVGTDDLEITNITSDNADFTVDWTTATLAMGESQDLVLTYTPGAVEADAGVLTILSNDSDESELAITLAGQGVAAPVIDVTPGVFDITLNSGDSTGYIMTIDNTAGGSDLIVSYSTGNFAESSSVGFGMSGEMGNSAEAHSSAPVSLRKRVKIASEEANILIIQNTTAWGLDMYSFINDNYDLSPDVIGYTSIPDTDFGNYDLIITVGDENTNYYNTLSAHVDQFESFVNNGGVLQYQIATQDATVDLVGGVLSRFGPGENLNLKVLDHPITEGLPDNLEGNFANHNVLINLPANAEILTRTSVSAEPTTATYNFGRGRVVATGMTVEYLYGNGFDAGPILGNMFEFSLEQTGSSRWLSLGTETETIPAGNSSTVEVSIDADGLLGGTYESTIIISSNDPVTPQVDVPVTLTVRYPQATLSASEINVVLFSDDLHTESIEIGNIDGGSNLTYEIDKISSEASSLGSTLQHTTEFIGLVEPVSKEAANDLESIIHTSEYVGKRKGQSIGVTSNPDLTEVKAELDESFETINSLIPNRYDFFDGVTGNSISDGGGDMYDGGNFLSTNLGANIDYTNGLITNSDKVGNENYFTVKYPGLFVFATDLNGVSSFSINGNLGADGSGQVDGSVLSVTQGSKEYLGFVKRVYDTSDPSVNHLVIVEDNGSATHEFSTNTNNDYHEVSGLEESTRAYYLLYASESGGYINDETTLTIMTEFLQLVEDDSFSWLDVTPSEGLIAPGETNEINLDINLEGLDYGEYTLDLLVNTNDPENEQIRVPVTVTFENDPPVIGVSDSEITFDDTHITSRSSKSVSISNSGGATLDGSLRFSDDIFSVADPNFTVLPGETLEILLYFQPASGQTYSSILEIVSNDPINELLQVVLSGEGLFNDLPQIVNAISDQSINEDAVFEFIIPENTFSDNDDDPLTISVNGLPSSMSFDAATDRITGTPLQEDVNTFTVEVTATDPYDGTVTDSFELTINNVNDAPVVSNALSDQSVDEDAMFEYTIPEGTFSDEDGDVLALSVSGLPSSLSFDVATSKITGIPVQDDVSSLTVEVIAADPDDASVVASFILTINNVNDIPVVGNAISDQSIDEDAVFEYTIPEGTFLDEDGDVLTLSVTGLPSSLSFNGATNTITGTPLQADVNTYTIEVTGTDPDDGSASDQFELLINSVNDSPVLVEGIPDQVVDIGMPFSLSVSEDNVTDEEDDDITISVSGLPVSLRLSGGVIDGTPEQGEGGDYTVAVTYSDGNGGSVVDTFILTINLVTSIELPNEYGVVNAYPNPFTNKINITVEKGLFGSTEFSLRSIGGNSVWMTNQDMSGETEMTLNIDTILPDGFYLLIIKSGGKSVVVKKVLKL